MRLPIYQVDAFTDRLFGGNPASIVPLDSWPPDATLQAIAAENNLSETAYLVKRGGDYEIRWFTPAIEADLCGHATLASAWAVFNLIEPGRDRVSFATRRAGTLTVERRGDLLAMDFPARPPEPLASIRALETALGATPRETLKAVRDYVAVFASAEEVRRLTPDFRALRTFDPVIATAPGSGDVDFVSRFFAPSGGIDEDPVTGSAHSTLIPFWAKRLAKDRLHARQISARGGELFCEAKGDRVEIAGKAVLYLEGWITV